MSKNDITGDNLHGRPNSKAFDENFDKIFGKKQFEMCRACSGSGSVTCGEYPTYYYAQCPVCEGAGKVQR